MVGGGGVGPLPPVATGGMDMTVMNWKKSRPVFFYFVRCER